MHTVKLKSKLPDEQNRFVQAHLSGKPVIEMTSVSDMTELQFCFLKIAQSFGIQNVPQQDHLEMVVGFVQRNFPNLTMREVSLAFELHAMKELETDAIHYGTLNIEFVADVLKSFGVKRYPYIERFRRERDAPPERPKLQADPTVVRQIELRAHYDMIVKFCDEHGKIPAIADWVSAFHFLEQEGMIHMTNEEKAAYVVEVKRRAKERIDRENIGDVMRMNLLNELDKPAEIKWLCRVEAAKDYFTNYIKQKKDGKH